MITARRTPARATLRRVLVHLALACLGYAALGASAPPRAPVVAATLSLDDFFYFPGQIPTLSFTATGFPRKRLAPGEEFEVYLGFSRTRNALQNSIFPPYFMGQVGQFGTLQLQLNQITCLSPVSTYIRGFVLETRTNTIIALTNEVELSTIPQNCPPPKPPGGEGCDATVWKASPGLWPLPLLPTTLFADVFEDAFPGETLLEVFDQEGAPLAILGRQTVTALMNAESPAVDYDLSAAEVIALFDQTFPGTDAEYLNTAILLYTFNVQGCPLTLPRNPLGVTPTRARR